jgi:predicted oxidoreductase
MASALIVNSSRAWRIVSLIRNVASIANQKFIRLVARPFNLSLPLPSNQNINEPFWTKSKL